MRVIIERLVKKLDYESVAEHIPEAERKLLVHIRKEHQRKAKRGQSELGSEVSEETLLFLDNAKLAQCHGQAQLV